MKVTERATPSLKKNARWWWLVGAVTVLAAGLRLWMLDSVPPGWRDDELINSLVISQRALDGDIRVYYDDASGHEALYHLLNAPFLAWFGPSAAGIRLLSAMMGTLTVPLTWWLGRTLWRDRRAALVAAAVLAVSFWGLMYSRTGIRHISLPLLVVPAFAFYRRALFRRDGRPWADILGAGGLLGLSFYTYFASRGVPLILLAFAVYLTVVQPGRWRRWWAVTTAVIGLGVLLAVPLAVTLAQQPESEARVAELAVPIVAARGGNFEPLRDHIVRTFNMFHTDGDEEFLYNLYQRPVFGPLGAVVFWLGVGMAGWLAGRAIWSRWGGDGGAADDELAWAGAFLLLWWLAGISPAFLSVPPASMSHTILAQPAVYLLLAFPPAAVARYRPAWVAGWRFWVVGGLLVTAVAARDLPDYFIEWPQHPSVQFLYRADIHAAADYLHQRPELLDTTAVAELTPGPWDRLALHANLDGALETSTAVRWFDPARAAMERPSQALILDRHRTDSWAGGWYVKQDNPAGQYILAEIDPSRLPHLPQTETCFANGLCARATADDGRVWLRFRVARPLDLPPMPLISNPPPPGVYAGPRLMVFVHLLGADGNYVTGDDGLGIDPQTIRPDDVFWQQHVLLGADASTDGRILFGLYDPMTGARIPTDDGADAVPVERPDE